MHPKRPHCQAGFTLVELLVTQALGLTLISVLSASLSTLYTRIQVSADAAENTETAYFLMDALQQWLSDSRRVSLLVGGAAHPSSTLYETNLGAVTDPCDTPARSPFSFSRAGVAVIPAVDVSCLQSSSLQKNSSALLIERRILCQDDCRKPDFYAEKSECGQGPVVTEWRSEDDLPGICEGNTRTYQIHRLLIYVRDYSHRRGDAIPALMVARLAPEPEPRWLRSAMLASAVFDWDLLCTNSCDLIDQRTDRAPRGLFIEFRVQGAYRSTRLERMISLDLPWH